MGTTTENEYSTTEIEMTAAVEAVTGYTATVSRDSATGYGRFTFPSMGRFRQQ